MLEGSTNTFYASTPLSLSRPKKISPAASALDIDMGIGLDFELDFELLPKSLSPTDIRTSFRHMPFTMIDDALRAFVYVTLNTRTRLADFSKTPESVITAMPIKPAFKFSNIIITEAVGFTTSNYQPDTLLNTIAIRKLSRLNELLDPSKNDFHHMLLSDISYGVDSTDKPFNKTQYLIELIGLLSTNKINKEELAGELAQLAITRKSTYTNIQKARSLIDDNLLKNHAGSSIMNVFLQKILECYLTAFDKKKSILYLVLVPKFRYLLKVAISVMNDAELNITKKQHDDILEQLMNLAEEFSSNFNPANYFAVLYDKARLRSTLHYKESYTLRTSTRLQNEIVELLISSIKNVFKDTALTEELTTRIKYVIFNSHQAQLSLLAVNAAESFSENVVRLIIHLTEESEILVTNAFATTAEKVFLLHKSAYLAQMKKLQEINYEVIAEFVLNNIYAFNGEQENLDSFANNFYASYDLFMKKFAINMAAENFFQMAIKTRQTSSLAYCYYLRLESIIAKNTIFITSSSVKALLSDVLNIMEQTKKLFKPESTTLALAEIRRDGHLLSSLYQELIKDMDYYIPPIFWRACTVSHPNFLYAPDNVNIIINNVYPILGNSLLQLTLLSSNLPVIEYLLPLTESIPYATYNDTLLNTLFLSVLQSCSKETVILYYENKGKFCETALKFLQSQLSAISSPCDDSRSTHPTWFMLSSISEFISNRLNIITEEMHAEKVLTILAT